MPDLAPFRISVRVAVISTIIVTVPGISMPKWLYRRRGLWVKLLESLLTLPIVLPPAVLSFILPIIFLPKGPVGQFFVNVPYLPVVFALASAVMASVIVSFPLMHQHTMQGLRGIDMRMINTTRTMGTGETKISLKLILPLIRHSILAGIAMSLTRTLGEFGATLMVIGCTLNETNTLPLEIYFLVEQDRESEAWLRVLVLVAFSIVVISTINLSNKDKYKEVDQMLKTNVKYQLEGTLIRIDIDDTEPKTYAVRSPSGTGKTTVLNMIAGLYRTDEAIIEVNG